MAITAREVTLHAIGTLMSQITPAYATFKAILKRDRGNTAFYTYFGALPIIEGLILPKVLVRRAVPWKGLKFGKYPNLRLPPGTPSGVLTGLNRAIGISKNAAGTYGVVAYKVGEMVAALPAKAMRQVELAGKTMRVTPEQVAAGTTIGEAIAKIARLPLIRPKTLLAIPRPRRAPAPAPAPGAGAPGVPGAGAGAGAPGT